MQRKKIFAVLVLMIVIASFFSLTIGPSKIPISQAFRALTGQDGEIYGVIMRDIRLPRLCLSLIIGFALGLSGAAMQGYLRNPLAEPGVLGVSSSAALGAVIALQTGLAIGKTGGFGEGWSAVSMNLILPICAILGASLSAILLMIFGKNARSERLILIGIGISALTGALISLVLNLSPNPFAASEIMFWLMGSVADRSMLHVWLVLPFVLIGALMLWKISGSFDALSLGEDTAQSLGVSIPITTAMLIIAVTALIGSTVAVAGAIGFIGLVVPHMIRPFIGEKPSKLLWPSALGGAALLTFADVLTRIIAPERDIKLGVLTALIGAPMFLHLVYSTRKRSGR